MLLKIREAVAESGEPFFNFLVAQFFILYGLMQYETYNRAAAARALGLIAGALSRQL